MTEAGTGLGGFPLFYATLFACIATLGLIFPNATAAAMAPYGREAGAASAVLGLLQYAVGAAAGAAVGLLHDGSARPMAAAVAACEAGVWLVVMASERQRASSRASVPPGPRPATRTTTPDVREGG